MEEVCRTVICSALASKASSANTSALEAEENICRGTDLIETDGTRNPSQQVSAEIPKQISGSSEKLYIPVNPFPM